MFSFACPKCQQDLKAPEEKSGAATRCRFCGQAITIPAAPTAVQATVPPAAVVVPTANTPISVERIRYEFQKDIGVTAAGAATSIATGLLLWLIEVFTGLSIYTFSACCVVPVGAMFAGALAASGYYVGARLLGRRPSPWLMLNMLVISVMTFFMIHIMTYVTIKLFGDPDPQFSSFFTYLGTVYRESETQIRGSNIGKLGAWGYLEMLLEIAGFAIGGIAVYGFLLMLLLRKVQLVPVEKSQTNAVRGGRRCLRRHGEANGRADANGQAARGHRHARHVGNRAGCQRLSRTIHDRSQALRPLRHQLAAIDG